MARSYMEHHGDDEEVIMAFNWMLACITTSILLGVTSIIRGDAPMWQVMNVFIIWFVLPTNLVFLPLILYRTCSIPSPSPDRRGNMRRDT